MSDDKINVEMREEIHEEDPLATITKIVMVIVANYKHGILVIT